MRRPDGQDITVLTVWDSSIERATAESEGARNVLDLLAYIPRALLAADDESLLRDGDPLYVDEALAALARYSLVDLHRAHAGEILTISTHRLVQEVTRLATKGNDPCATAIRLLRRTFPVDPIDHATWPLCQVLEPHVIVATAHADRLDTELTAASWLLDRSGTYLLFSGDPLSAPASHERAVDLHTRIAGSNLADAYWSAGPAADALALMERVVVDSERVLGPSIPTPGTRPRVLEEWRAGE